MKILIVNDERLFGEPFQELLSTFPTVSAVFAHMYRSDDCELRTSALWAPSELLQAVNEADVIFLDHRMPIPGDVMFERWRAAGVQLDSKRIIGTSSDGQKAQTYVKEHYTYKDREDLKKFLGIV